MNPILALLFTIPALAGPDADHEPHEPHPPAQLCDHGKVQACIAENRAAIDRVNEEAAGLDIQIALESAATISLRAELQRLQGLLDANHAEQAAITAEEAFLAAPEPAPAPEIFSGFPSAEEFFGLDPLERQWHERYPAERARRLGERLLEAKSDESRLSGPYGEITQKFRKVSDQITSWSDARAHLVTVAGQHAFQCNQGCRDQLCPPREP